MIKRLVIIFLICFLGKTTFAQANWEKYEPWKGTDDFNPVGTEALTIDSFGNKWMICILQDSVNIAKFDGSTWTYYSIPGAVTYWNITTDRLGSVYVTTSPNGVYKFDGNTWQYYFPQSITDIVFDSANNMWTVMGNFYQNRLVSYDGVDTIGYPLCQQCSFGQIAISPGNEIALGTFNGLYIFNNGTFTHYTTGNSQLPSDTLPYTIQYDKNGILWGIDAINFHHHIFRFDGANWQEFQIPDSIANYSFHLVIDNGTGRIYLTSWGYNIGAIIEFDGATFKKYEPPFCMWLPVDLDIDQDGILWISTNYGLCDSSLYTFKNLSLDGIKQNVLSNSVVISPNPVSNELTISFENKNISRMQIIDILGRIVFSSKPITSYQIKVDLSTWANGMYLVKEISNNKMRIAGKFLKQ